MFIYVKHETFSEHITHSLWLNLTVMGKEEKKLEKKSWNLTKTNLEKSISLDIGEVCNNGTKLWIY